MIWRRPGSEGMVIKRIVIQNEFGDLEMIGLVIITTAGAPHKNVDVKVL